MGSFGALSSKWLLTRKRLAVVRKDWNKRFWDSSIHMGYIWPCRVQCPFGVIRCTFLKMASNSKTTGHSAKRTAN